MDRSSPIRSCRLQDGVVALNVLNLGAITQGIWASCGGQTVAIVLGYKDPTLYQHDPNYLGAVVGRVANRIAGGKLVLDGQTCQLSQNEGANQLHGGTTGLHRKVWDMDEDKSGRRVRLQAHSPYGEDGYPGAVDFSVEISLKGSQVTYMMEAKVDRPMPINMAQHNYYNLMGRGHVWDHHLTIQAERYTPVDEQLIPTGEIASVEGTQLDYRQGAKIADADPQRLGADHNLVLNQRDETTPVVTANAPNGLQMRMSSDQPGLQFYTGGGLNGIGEAHDGQTIEPNAGFCLEPQGFPNAVNEPRFPSIMVSPETPYRQTLTLDIRDMNA